MKVCCLLLENELFTFQKKIVWRSVFASKTTSLSPVLRHLFRFHCDFVCCTKEVRDLISHPVVSLLDTRVGGTRAEVVTKRVYLKLPETTSRERYFRQEWNVRSNERGKKGLTETSRPGLIPVMSPDLSQSTHCLEPQYPWGNSLPETQDRSSLSEEP